jgi:hypothetical protein
VASHERDGAVGVALERHVQQLHAGLGGDLLHGEVERCAGTRRGVGKLARVRLGVLDEVLESLELRVGADHHAERVAREADDVGEVVDRVPVHLLHVRLAEGGDGELRDGVPVRLRGPRHGDRSVVAAAAGAVLDHQRLAQVLGGDLAQPAEIDVGAAARRPGHDQGNRLGRELLGRRDRCKKRATERGSKRRCHAMQIHSHSSSGRL